MARPENIARTLGELRAGKKEAESRLFEAIYPVLLRLASHYMKKGVTGDTLEAADLVHDAYLRLAGQSATSNWQDRSYFFAVAAGAMRRVLVDLARRRKYVQEGGKKPVDLNDGLVVGESPLDEILRVDDALDQLARWNPLQSKLVELRFFGGLSDNEIAKVLGMSERTVQRHSSDARAWLYSRLREGPPRQDINVLEYYGHHREEIDLLADEQALFILTLVHFNGVISVEELSTQTGWEQSAVTEVCERLHKPDFVRTNESNRHMYRIADRGMEVLRLVQII